MTSDWISVNKASCVSERRTLRICRSAAKHLSPDGCRLKIFIFSLYRQCDDFIRTVIMPATVGKGAINVAFVRPSVSLSLRPSRTYQIIRESKGLACPSVSV